MQSRSGLRYSMCKTYDGSSLDADVVSFALTARSRSRFSSTVKSLLAASTLTKTNMMMSATDALATPYQNTP